MTGFNFETLSDVVLNELTAAGLDPITDYEEVPRVPSGSIAVDWATSGGWARGRYNMIYGEESSGKSTLFFIAAATAMKRDPNALVGFIETGAEATDPMWISRLGIDMRRFVHISADSTEQALNALRKMIALKRFTLICLDSIAAMAAEAEVNKEIGDNEWALNARLLNDYFKRDASALKKAYVQPIDVNTGEVLPVDEDNPVPPPAVILINQVREEQGVSYGDGERITGGRQLKHAVSISVRVKKPNMQEVTIDSDGMIASIDQKIKVKKCKVGPPFREAEYTVLNDRHNKFFGVDTVRETVTMAKNLGLLTSASGKSWSSGRVFLHDEEIPIDTELKVPTGEKKYEFYLRQFLRSNPDWFERLYVNIVEFINASRYDDTLMSMSTSAVLQYGDSEEDYEIEDADNREEA